MAFYYSGTVWNGLCYHPWENIFSLAGYTVVLKFCEYKWSIIHISPAMLLLVEKRFLKLTNSITIQLNTYNNSTLATFVRNQNSSLKKKIYLFSSSIQCSWGCCLLHLKLQNRWLKSFLSTLILMTLFTCCLRPKLKLHSIRVTPTMVKFIINLNLSEVSGPDFVPVVDLKNVKFS